MNKMTILLRRTMKLSFSITTAGHSSYYTLLRPVELIEGLFSELKWAYQRLTRGWDDRASWSIDYWLNAMMPDILLQLRQTKHGTPMWCFDGLEPNETQGYNNEDAEKAREKWNLELDKMIAGFVAAKKENDLEFVTMDNFEKEWETLETVRKQGMTSFVEHYGDLWD